MHSAIIISISKNRTYLYRYIMSRSLYSRNLFIYYYHFFLKLLISCSNIGSRSSYFNLFNYLTFSYILFYISLFYLHFHYIIVYTVGFFHLIRYTHFYIYSSAILQLLYLFIFYLSNEKEQVIIIFSIDI